MYDVEKNKSQFYQSVTNNKACQVNDAIHFSSFKRKYDNSVG